MISTDVELHEAARQPTVYSEMVVPVSSPPVQSQSSVSSSSSGQQQQSSSSSP
eukprot:CAMPEP_0116848372 /NCGR_PEP_ID=MMETSP0418-20121206/14961_1 /TAXON_ID=1158023 /ORGANISM="Astrosyne radiata, Strain 13vi08-1A" /LENGTH=52 /DNA_ID=CAMNT_0004479937 /DNA_START=43 /DNA_END=197 /DNA_ORIENTATION=+